MFNAENTSIDLVWGATVWKIESGTTTTL